MTIIEPERKNVADKGSIKKNSSTLRLWHWANVVVISGSLITVLINSTILDEHKIASFLQGSFSKAGGSVTASQAKSVANNLGDTVWDVHAYFGYCLAGLLLFRLVLEFFQISDQKFIHKFKSAYNNFKITKKKRQAALHQLTVEVIYALFYFLLIIMVVTGLSLAFDDDFQVLKSIHHPVKSVHGFCMYLILAFIIVHIAGVFLAERKKDGKGIVSDMINGG